MRAIRMLALAEAMELQNHLLDIANSDRLNPVAICIVDTTGMMLSAVTMDGTKEPSIATAHNKAVTAVQFQCDTIELCHKLDDNSLWVPDTEGGWTQMDIANAMNINPWFVSWGGGALVRSPHDDAILGAIGVSNRTEVQDHELASQRPAGWAA
jgi:uncharacterized protein GlcG (DUF336 family)